MFTDLQELVFDSQLSSDAHVNMSNAHILLPAADVDGQMWRKDLVRTSRKALERMCKQQVEELRMAESSHHHS